MVQQLTIFDAPVQDTFEIGDEVTVVVNVPEKDVENYYYLKRYEGATGKIVKLLPLQQYEVLFSKDNRVGTFRHNDLIRGDQG